MSSNKIDLTKEINRLAKKFGSVVSENTSRLDNFSSDKLIAIRVGLDGLEKQGGYKELAVLIMKVSITEVLKRRGIELKSTQIANGNKQEHLTSSPES